MTCVFITEYFVNADVPHKKPRILIKLFTECPTRYRTRHFFNNFTNSEEFATKFDTHYRHIPLHLSHNERTPVQISLQYLHWC